GFAYQYRAAVDAHPVARTMRAARHLRPTRGMHRRIDAWRRYGFGRAKSGLFARALQICSRADQADQESRVALGLLPRHLSGLKSCTSAKPAFVVATPLSVPSGIW